MRTLQDLFTPAEIQRFTKIANEGGFTDTNVTIFAEAFQRELDHIEFRRQEITEGRRRDHSSVYFPSPEKMQAHYDRLEADLSTKRSQAFDVALKALETNRPTLTRTMLDLQDLERGLLQVQPELGHRTAAEHAWDTYWEEKGIPRGIAEIGLSTVTAPVRGVEKAITGDWRHPLETVAELGSAVSVARGLGKLVSAGLSTSARTAGASGTLRKALDNRLWRASNIAVDVADIAGSREEVYLELAGEGGFEALGFGADLIRDRGRKSMLADNLIDQATGSKTSAPAIDYQRLFDEAAQAAAGELSAEAGFNVDDATADLQRRRTQRDIDALRATHGAGQAPTTDEIQMKRRQTWQGADIGDPPASDREQFWQDNLTPEEQRRQFWNENLSPYEQEQQRQAELEGFTNQFQLVETPTQEQRREFWQQNLTPAEQAEADTQQQQDTANLQAFEGQWGEFYRDQAGSYPEGRRIMEEEYNQGVRDPIEARYNRIVDSLKEQMGAAPSELHRETEARLRRLIGEKWYRRYREGRGHPTIDQRVQRVVQAAERMIGGDTDTDTTPDTDTGSQQVTPPDAVDTSQTQEQTDENTITTEEGYRLEKGEFAPTRHDRDTYEEKESWDVPAYFVHDTGIDWANIVVHHPQTRDGQYDTDRWQASDVNTGSTLGTSASGTTPEEAASKGVEILKNIGEEGYARAVETLRANIAEGQQKAEERQVEMDASLPSVKDVRNWERDGNTNRYNYKLGSGEVELVGNQEMAMATFQNLPNQQNSFITKEVTGRTIRDRLRNALEQLTEQDLDIQTAPDETQQTGQTQTQEETPTEHQPYADTPNMRLAAWVADKIAAEQEITRQDVIDKANEIYGGTFAEGAYELRQAYDAIEVGGNQYINRYEDHLQASVENATSFIRSIIDNVEAYLPTPTRRDLEQIESQQFSTPYHYAFLANWVANLGADDVILQPSAGTGNLAWWGRRAGNEVHVNEISNRRLRMLAQSGFENITNHDARNLNNLMKHDNPDFAPNVIVMNPPFSADAQTGTKSEMLGANMVTEALKLLAPGGRLVAIVSGGSPAFDDSVGMAFNGSQQIQRWWGETRSNYEVRANIKVSGKVYTKFGTEFDTRLLVIDKPMPGQEINNTPIAREVERVDQLPEMLKEIRDSRIDTTNTSTTPTTPSTPEGGGSLQARIATAAAERRRQRRAQRDQEQQQTPQQQQHTGDSLQARIAGAAAERRRQRRAEREREDSLSDISAEMREDYEIWREIAIEQQIAYYQELENLTEDDQAFLDALQSENRTSEQQEDYEIWEEIAIEQQIGYYQELESLTEDDQAFLDALQSYQANIIGGDTGATTEQTRTEPTGEGATPTGEPRTEPADTTSTPGTSVRDGQQPGTTEPDAMGRQRVSTELPSGDGQTDRNVGDATQTTESDVQRPGGQISTDQGGDTGSGQGTIRTDTGPDVSDDRQPGASTLDAYTPLKEKHVGDVQLVTSKNLAAIPSPSTEDIEVDIPHPEQLSEAQTAQVKKIIRIHEQFKSGEGGVAAYRKGYALAYGTGTGKTRIFSGVIIHNTPRQNRKRNLVLTINWGLYNKFKKDFAALGGDPDSVYSQEKVNGGNSFPDEDGNYVSTYSTLRAPGTVQNRKNKIKGRLEQVLEWLVGEKPPASVLGAAEIGTGMDPILELVHDNTLPRTLSEAVRFFNDFENTPPEIQYILDSYSYAAGQNNERRIERAERDYASLVRQLEEMAQSSSQGPMSASEWHALASQYDGTIVFDESHRAKNVGVSEDKDAAQQAVIAQSLLRLLPNARVVYSSATTTTKLVDAGYLERLSLFGPGTPYGSFAQFYAMFDKRVGMQEIGFSQLKAKGEFDAATLDMSGVEYGKLEHELTEQQVKDYNRLVDIWHTIQEAVADYIQTNKAAAKRANASIRFGGEWSTFWSANQRFWIDYLMSLQMNTVLNRAFEMLDGGDKVVFRLVNTGESSQKRQIERSRAEGTDIADAQLTLVEPIIRYMEKTFPTAAMTAVRNQSTGESTYTEATTRVQLEDGSWEEQIVEDQEMKRIKEQLLKQLNDISMPPPAIDIIVQGMRDRGVEIAEISGRAERYVWDNNTGERLKEDNIQSRKEGDIERFLNGDLRALVFSEAGGTGQDYHALQEDARHYLFVVQTGWNMENLEQGVGRVHRTGQTSEPAIFLAGTDAPAEARATMTALQHMRTMGAQVMGSEETGAARQMFGSGIEQYIGTDIGKATLLGMFEKMSRERETLPIEGITDDEGNPVRMTVPQILDYFGMMKTNQDGSKTFDAKNFKMEVFLNRIMNSYIEVQRAVFGKFAQTLKEAVDAAQADGTLDTGAEVLDTVTANIANETTLTTDQDSGAQTKLVEIDAEERNDKLTWEELTQRITEAPTGEVGEFLGFYRMPRGGIVAAFRGADQMVENQAVPRVRIVKVSGRDEFLPRTDTRLQNAEQLSNEVTPEIEQEWNSQLSGIPDTTAKKIYVATGLVTDNWSRLTISSEYEAQISLQDRYASTQIVRIQLDDGDSVLGKFVPERQVPFLFQEFGIDQAGVAQATETSTTVTPDVLLERILDGENLRLENNWTLALTTRDNTPIIMLRKGSGPVQNSTEMTNLGLRSISGTSGLEWFVPHGDSSVLEALLRRYPPRDTEIDFGDTNTETDPDDDGGSGAPPTTTPTQTPGETGETTTQTTEEPKLENNPQSIMDYLQQAPLGEVREISREDSNQPTATRGEVEIDIGQHATARYNKPERADNHIKWANVRYAIKDKDFAFTGTMEVYYGGRFFVSPIEYLEEARKKIELKDIPDRHGIIQTTNEQETERLQTLPAQPPHDFTVQERLIYEQMPDDITDIVGQNAPARVTMTREVNREVQAVKRDKWHSTLPKMREVRNAIFDSLGGGQGNVETTNNILTALAEDAGDTYHLQQVIGETQEMANRMPGSSLTQEAKALREADPNLTVKQAIDRASTRRLNRDRHGLLPTTDERSAAETEMHLEALGIDPANWEIWTEDERSKEVNLAYERLQMREIEEDDFEISSEQIQAVNTLISSLEDDSTLSDYEIASEYKAAIGVVPFPEPKTKRLRNLLNNIYRRKVPVNLIGHTLESAYEAAVLGQAYRDPEIETTRLIYIKDGKIVGHEGFTLNQTNSTHAPGWASVAIRLDDLNADSVVMLHNHPSGKAKFSRADRDINNKLLNNLGKRFLGHVIVDSGTYASFWYGEDGYWHYKNEVQLPSEAVGWDTSSELVGNRRVDDPLYRQTDSVEQRAISGYPDRDDLNSWYYDHISPTTTLSELNKDAEMAIVKLGKVLKVPENWITFAFMGDTKNLAAIVEYRDLQNMAEAELISFIDSETRKWGGTTVHIYIGDGDWYKSNDDIRKVFTPNVMSHHGVKSITIAGSDYSLKGGADHPGKFIEREGKYEVVESNFPTLQAEQIIYRSGSTTEDEGELSDYVAEVKAANPDSVLTVPLDDADLNLQGQGTSLTERALRKSLTFFDPKSPLREKLDLWTPGLRLKARQVQQTLHTAWRNLDKLRAPDGSDKPSPADYLIEVLFERTDSSQSLRSEDLALLRPLQKKRNTLLNKLAKDTGRDKTQLRSLVEYPIVEFVEHNKPISDYARLAQAGITDTSEIEAFANEFKEAWRQSNMQRAGYIVQLVEAAKEIGEIVNIQLESFDGFEYDWEAGGFRRMSKWNDREGRMRETTQDEQAKVWSIEEAHKAADRLYVPHHYSKSDIKRKLKRVDSLVAQLNDAARSGDISTLDKSIGIEENNGTYTFTYTDQEFDDVLDVIAHAQTYWTIEQASTKTYLDNLEQGVIGVFGHLERVRETDDRFYERDIDTIVKISQQALDRIAEIRAFGHINPITGSSPRIDDFLNQLRGWSKTPEEEAFLAVFVALRAGQPNSRYERAWDLGQENKNADFGIISEWHDRNTGEFTELDIDRLKARGVTDENLTELERVGFLEKDEAGNYKVRGKDPIEQHRTIQQHFTAFAQTKALREDIVTDLIRGLGNWDRSDPVDKTSNKIMRVVNGMTTVLTLGHRTALQNLLEYPHAQAMIGPKNSAKAIAEFTKDPDFRRLSERVVEAMRHTTQFMADSNFEHKYLQNPYLSGFSWSDQYSRALGAAGGIFNAEDVIESYIKNPTKANRAALRHVKINQAVIDAYRNDSNPNKKPLSEIFTEARERANKGQLSISGFQRTGVTQASDPYVDKIGQEVIRSAIFVSNTVLKRYDAVSLPSYLRTTNPFLRLFTKFIAWPTQHHSYLFRQLRYAVNEVKQNKNWQPAYNLLAASAYTASMGAATATLFAALQGRFDEDDDNYLQTALKGVAASHAFGMASMLLEAGLFAEGNTWLLEKALTTRGAGPTIGVWARMGSPVLTGDWTEAFEQTLRRIPVLQTTFTATPVRKLFEGEDE